MASLVLNNVKKAYNKDIIAVQDFNIEIEEKEFIVLVGPSGCGKSTTLRMVAGLEEITEGEMYIDGKLINNTAPKDRDIAMVFQNYALYPHMTVFENMAFALKLRKTPKKEIVLRVNEAAKILDITDYLQRKPKELSGGQRQRVAIGRAIVRHPKVFLMDEPLSNLDAKLRNQMRAEIIKLRERVDTTFIYVTHDQIEAMTLGDRIVVMNNGFVQQIGTPSEVFNKPSNRFVAGFIGAPSMNFFDADLIKKDDKYLVKIMNKTFELSEEKQKLLIKKGVSPKSIIIGVRPENVMLCEENCDVINGILEVSEVMGSEIFLHVIANERKIIIKITSPDEMKNYVFDTRSHKPVYFNLDKDRMHLFDKDSGNNLFYV